MGRGHRLAVGLLIVALTTFPSPSAGRVKATDSATGPLPGSAEAEAIRFRETFGFQADRAFVEATLEAPERYSDDAYGVPLSDAEVAELLRRAAIEDALGPAVELARSRGDFAGLYIDQLRGGMPVFMFTSPNPDLAEKLRNILPDGSNAEVIGASRTEEALAKLKNSIEGDLAWWSDAGIEIVSVGIRTSLNTVRVGILKLTPESVASLQSRYGIDIVVYETKVARGDICDATNNCRPMKGGIAINPTGHPDPVCTAGFVVRRTDTGGLAILTAGHCVQKWGGFDQAWQHNSQGFGRALRETFEAGGSSWADVGLITIQSPEVALMTQKNQMRRTNGSVANVTSHVVLAQGGQACRVGLTSGHDCGAIVDSDVGHWSVVPGLSSMWVSHTAEVNFDSQGGDSGGPVFRYPGGGTCCSPVYALGTHVHSLDPADATGWYSPIYWGVQDYDAITYEDYTFTLCLNSGCTP